MHAHVEDAEVVKQGDGSYELVLKVPCTSVNREMFNHEAVCAFVKFLMIVGTPGTEDVEEVWWMHNGVRCTTKWARMSGGSWGQFTEANSVQAN